MLMVEGSFVIMSVRWGVVTVGLKFICFLCFGRGDFGEKEIKCLFLK